MTSGTASLRKFCALWLAMALLLALSWGCGGGEAEGEDFSADLVFTFDDEEPAAGGDDAEPAVVYSPFTRLTDTDRRHGRVAYVYDIQSMTLEMEASRRTMVRLLEGAMESGGNLDWVTQVHDEHRVSEELRVRAFGYGLPEELEDDYVDFHVGFLETVQTYAYGADRMLLAAVMIGPTGRSVHDLAAAERSEFTSLVSEGNFYLQDADVLSARIRDDLREIASGLRLR